MWPRRGALLAYRDASFFFAINDFGSQQVKHEKEQEPFFLIAPDASQQAW